MMIQLLKNTAIRAKYISLELKFHLIQLRSQANVFYKRIAITSDGLLWNI